MIDLCLPSAHPTPTWLGYQYQYQCKAMPPQEPEMNGIMNLISPLILIVLTTFPVQELSVIQEKNRFMQKCKVLITRLI